MTTQKPLSAELAALDAAMKLLVFVQHKTHGDELYDILDALSEYRDKYVQDNSQFGVGA